MYKKLQISSQIINIFYIQFPNREAKNVTIEELSSSEILIKPKFTTCAVREELDQNADKIQNIYDMFTYSSEKFSSKKCLGVRPLLEETKVNQNGKIEEKVKLGDEYKWHTFKDVQERIVHISNGLAKTTSLKERDNVIIYADTCIEWFISVMACFRNNYTVATLYTNLGTDGIR